MKFFRLSIYAVLFTALYFPFKSNAQGEKFLTVKINESKATVQPTMWGVFFEDINLGADGGIYAELVKNRSFEFSRPLMGWKVQQKLAKEGSVLVINRKEENASNPRFIRVVADHASRGDLGLTNEGFRGMGIKKELKYDFSVMYRQQSAGVKMHVELTDSAGKIIGAASLSPNEAGAGWHKASVSFIASATVLKAKMNVWIEGNGVIDLDMISLFPTDTWKNRPGGMRADMIQLLADMKPGFIRFPGGCIVEGFDLSTRYQWKKTIGPVEQRQLIINRWNTEFAHRPAPDYFQTFGLGFFEYFQLAEDIGAEPLPILNCGMACQFNTAEVVPLNELDPYIRDALDLIEFANGDVSTTWGKVRADLGHPLPFQLKMMGVGNENWGPQYVERLTAFTKAIKAKYPGFKIVNSSGTDPEGGRFDYLDGELRKMNADIIDEHYYRKPEWFFANARRYDNYPRTGSKIFGGEYAAQSDKTVSVNNKNNWLTALSEAAFMTGLERNADVVVMASYAPLFAHIDGWQWTPDLIWVNNLQSYGTPDYYVQKLYALNKGTKVVPITLNNDVVAGQDSLYASAVTDAAANELIIKIVNASARPQPTVINVQGAKKLASKGLATLLQSDDLNRVNSFDDPQKLSPKESAIVVKGNKINYTAAPYSFSVIKVQQL
ncbi:MAG: alpha-L-arabinofuranosidase [Ferruginibacter sp.]|nr:alpha-L-arabinofuranosidase [Ferruginibacter sp.]